MLSPKVEPLLYNEPKKVPNMEISENTGQNVGSNDSVGEKAPGYERIDYKIGDLDSFGDKILLVHYSEPDAYIIYETEDRKVRCAGAAVNASLSGKDALHAQLTKYADLTTHTPSLKQKYNSHVAHAVRLALGGDLDASVSVLQGVVDKVTRYLTRRCQFAYLLGVLLLSLSIVVVYLIAWVSGRMTPESQRVLACIMFATLGGVMSVAISLRKLEIDKDDEFGVNIFYGGFRIVIAGIAGVIIYYLIEARIVFGFLREAQEANGLYIAAFLSGFSEMLVPDLMRQINKPGKVK
jgi:hypothetical protein